MVTFAGRDGSRFHLGEVSRIAVGIEAPYYLIPRVEIEGSSQYRISITLGQAGHGDEGRTVFSNTVGRRVDYVERTLGRTAEEAVAGDAD